MHDTTVIHARDPLTHGRCFYLDTKLGDTALLVAARHAKGDIVKLLLANKANRDVRDKVRGLWMMFG